ncbi:MAG: heme A synthase [Crocinitomicaceae bacterium TMED209]|nr:MAG: heme A synthase [Crocinitomicaceae bacterium TMED209]
MRRLTRVAMAMTFLVVLAGSVVRMTGSGMGCPDWPKCFGLMIPPTEASEVTWQEGATYDRGRMLLKRDTLWVAQADLHSTDFEAERATGQWVAYDKHDYAVFNPLHTWVEFINRLLGALTGIPALLLLGWTFWRGVKVRHWKPFAWAVVHLFWLGLVAWLGKKVVDGNLIPFSITIHMLGAMAILVSLAGLLHSVWEHQGRIDLLSRGKGWIAVALVLTVAQLVLGTQVREQVDLLNHAELLRADWIGALPGWWKVHRSGSWVVLAVQLMWLMPLRNAEGSLRTIVRLASALLSAQILTGVLFVNFGMPAWAQPVHLLLAVGLVLTNVWVLLHYRAQRV